MGGLIVAGLAGLAWYLFLYDDGRADAATAAADAFVTSWSAQDWAALDAATNDPAAADAHATLAESLDVTETRVTIAHLGLDDVGEGVADARYEASHDVEGLGTWTYSGEFEVVAIGDDWSVRWEPSVLHPEYVAGHSFRRTRFWPQRAPIQGPDGQDLAGEGDVVIVGIEPQRLDDPQDAVDAIDELTPATAADAEAVLARGDLRDDWFYPVVTMARSAYDEVRDELRPVPGLVFQEDSDRTGASPATEELVGHVDEVTEEQLEQLGLPYQAGDVVGRSGLEASLERRLAGSPGGAIVLVDEDGEEVTTLHEVSATEPEPVRLTLDMAVQDAAAAAFSGDDRAGGLVAIDAETGAVRAVVSRPAEGFARAMTGQYAPGSTFKVVTAAALLANGVAPDDTLECPGEFNAGGRSFRNAADADLGTVDLTEAFAESCNTAFIGAAAELPDDALDETAERFGFGREPDSAYAVAGRRVPASFPPPADAAEAAAAAIGQGRVTASPLQMASVAATATTGVHRPPYLLAEDETDGTEVLSAEDSARLVELMRAVVTDGTGTEVDVEGAVGKTGTAQADGDVEHAWFVGEYDGLAFAVIIEEGGAGGTEAAPLANRFLEALGG
jgi:cell division protein FtsI/penicillin-binding protein 2